MATTQTGVPLIFNLAMMLTFVTMATKTYVVKVVTSIRTRRIQVNYEHSRYFRL